MRYVFIVVLCGMLFSSISYAGETPDTEKPAKESVAVFDFEVTGAVDIRIARPLADSVRQELFRSGTFDVVDRSDVEKLLQD